MHAGVIDDAGIVIDIGIDPLGAKDAGGDSLQLDGQLIELGPACLGENMFRQLLKHRCPRVLDLVDAMAKAHDFLLVCHRVLEPGTSVRRAADFFEHVEDLFVGSAMQWSGKRADRRADNRVRIGQRRAGNPAAKSGGIHRVLGMQNQACVQHLAYGGRRFTLEQHPVEVGGVIEVVARGDRVIAVPEPVKGSDDGWHFRDEANDRLPVALGVHHVASRVEHAHRSHAGLQGVHRVPGFREALDEVLQLVLDPPVVAELVVEVGQLALAGQLALEQQPAGFLEAAFAGERFDGDAAVFQPSPLAVDEADARLRHRHIRQPRP